MNSEIFGKSDPYVRAVIRGDVDVFTTKVVQNNLNPVWDEVHEFHVYNDSSDVLYITIYDRDKAQSDDVLGKCELSIASLPRNACLNIQRQLVISGKRRAGILHMVIEYKPFVIDNVILGMSSQDKWSMGFLYVDIRSLTGVSTDKSVSVYLAANCCFVLCL